MRYLPVFCLLLATALWGQQERQSAPSDVPPEYRPPVMRDNDEHQTLPATAATVAPDAAVITIKGLCEKPDRSVSGEPSRTSCQTLITRAQFEKLTDAILSNMKPSMQRQVANSYPDLLAMAQAAEARGLENNPHFQQRLAFARLQILSQELVRQIDDESSQISDKDLEDYYHSHAAEFETATLERIFVPNHKRMGARKATDQASRTEEQGSEEAMTRLSEELRTQAVAGDDFMTLQKKAYDAAGMTDVPPNPSLGRLRAVSLPAGHGSVLELKAGEVSNVLSDSTGHYIYKLDNKEAESFDAAKSEIHKVLQNQRREEAIRTVTGNITSELNLAYFGPQGTGPAGPKTK